MKFSCDNCGAQYRIDDQRIGPSGVKVRCKMCRHDIILRRPEADDEELTATQVIRPEAGWDAGLGDEATMAVDADRAAAAARSADAEVLARDAAGASPFDTPAPRGDASPAASPFDAALGPRTEASASPFDGPDEPLLADQDASDVPEDEPAALPLPPLDAAPPDEADEVELPAASSPPDDEEPETTVTHTDFDALRPDELPEPQVEEAAGGPGRLAALAALADEEPEAADAASSGDEDETGDLRMGLERSDRAEVEGDEPLDVAFGLPDIEVDADDGASLEAEAAPELEAPQPPADATEPSLGAPVSADATGASPEAPADPTEPSLGAPVSADAVAASPEVPADPTAPSLGAPVSADATGPSGGAAAELGEETPDLERSGPGEVRRSSLNAAFESAARRAAQNLGPRAGSSAGARVSGLPGEPAEAGRSTGVRVTGLSEEEAAAMAKPLPREPSDSSASEIEAAFDSMFAGDAEPILAEPPPEAAPAEPEAPPPLAKAAVVTEKAARWYLGINGEREGPFTRDEVEARWSSGAIDGSTPSWCSGMSDWRPIEQVPELAELAATPSSSPRERSAVGFGASGGPLTGEVRPSIVLGEDPPTEPESAGGWRPGAASALLSLAEEELAQSPTTAKEPRKPTTGKMTALPTSPDLSKLIGSGDATEGTASMFGLSEKSVSKVLAIPKRAEAASTAPLVDTPRAAPRVAAPRQGGGSTGKIVAAAGALLVLLIAGGAWALLSGDAEPEVARAPAAPEAAPAPAPKPAPSVATAPTPPAPAPTPTEVAPQAMKTEPETAPALPSAEASQAEAPATPEVAQVEPKPAKPEPAKPEPAKVETAPKKPEPVAVAPTRRPSPRRTRSTRSTRSRRSPPPAPVVERREPPKVERRAPPPAPKPAPRSSVDDLLGAAPSKPRAAPPKKDKLEDAEVFGVLRKNRAQVRDCIEKHSADGGETGRVRVSITIEPTGRVSQTRFSPASFQRSVLGRCLGSAARTWRFPTFDGKAMPVDFPVTVK